jgi:hypothetical protein
MDDATSVRSYLQLDGVDFKGCFYDVLEKLSCIIIVRTPLLSFIFIRSFIVVNF